MPDNSSRWRRVLWLPLLLTVVLGAGCAPRPVEGEVEQADGPLHALLATATIASPATPAPSPVPPTPLATSTAVAPPATPQPLLNPAVPIFVAEAAAWNVEHVVLDGSNTGYWQFPSATFLHPIALEVVGDVAYLIDGGRVLAVELTQPGPPQMLLAPGDRVQDVPVLEPLDLAQAGKELLVLDRAGDVYVYDLAAQNWTLDRYDRPVGDSSGQYFVAIDAGEPAPEGDPAGTLRALLETNYKFVQVYGEDTSSLWNLPERRGVDVKVTEGLVHVLQREMHEVAGALTLYENTRLLDAFRVRFPLAQPRQLVHTSDELIVLDQAGGRLVALAPDTGALLRLIQPPQDARITAVAHDPQHDDLVLAGRDRLYFPGRPEQRAVVAGGDLLRGLQPHDLDLLNRLDDFIVPITGSNITFRDFQMPGAPRHYRLGVHNGLDLYWQPGTGVRAIGDGVVVRADTDYVPPSAADLARWAADSAARGYTTEEVLDNYMGRQIWIEHEPGVVSRYAHLRAIAPGISAGTAVTRGQPIGEVGNSGSPASLQSEQADAHLHFELWLGDQHLGQYLRPIETRELVEAMFPTNR